MFSESKIELSSQILDSDQFSLGQPLLVVISGLSGAGKDSVVRTLQKRGLPFHFVVTATSRPKREEEIDGKDYLFVSEQDFEEMIAHDELLEHALVYGQHKGVPKTQVREALASGKDVIMRLDVQGAAAIREKYPDAILIFIAVSEKVLLQRLQSRQTESAEQLQLRRETARQEYARVSEFDYVVVNEDGLLDETADTVEAIIRAEHHRVISRKIEL